MNTTTLAQQLLPKEAYFSQRWFDEERKHLFDQSWIFACFETELSDGGDYVTLRYMDHPLFVVRDQEGSLNAYHNVCRHRGCEVLEGKGNTKTTIMCPYHRWTYQLDGELRGVPNEGECFENLPREELSLHRASVGVYAGMVFVNPSANPKEDFSSWIANMDEYLWPHRFDDGSMVCTGEVVYQMACNWKVFYENAIDGYHLGYLHDKTLGKVYPSRNVWDLVGRHHVWYSTETGEKKSNTVLSVENADQFNLPRLHSDSEATYPGVVMLFPLTLLAPNPWGIYISILEPKGPEVTMMRSIAWAPAGSGGRFDMEGERSDVIRLADMNSHPLESGNFQLEDMWIVEKIQRNLRSPHYKVGPLAQGVGAEQPLYEFQQSILDYVSTT